MIDPAEKFLHQTVTTLLQTAKRSGPQEFRAFIVGGIIANTLGNLPAEYFEQMLEAEPCDRVGCDCHLMAAKTNATLRAIREDYLTHRPEKGFSE